MLRVASMSAMIPHKVLVVDDDELFLKVCLTVLRRAGFEVDGVGDPLEALTRLGQEIQAQRERGIAYCAKPLDAVVSISLPPDAHDLVAAMSRVLMLALEWGAKR